MTGWDEFVKSKWSLLFVRTSSLTSVQTLSVFECSVIVCLLNKNCRIVLHTRSSCCFFSYVFLFRCNENMCLFSVWSRHPDKDSVICRECYLVNSRGPRLLLTHFFQHIQPICRFTRMTRCHNPAEDDCEDDSELRNQGQLNNRENCEAAERPRAKRWSCRSVPAVQCPPVEAWLSLAASTATVCVCANVKHKVLSQCFQEKD